MTLIPKINKEINNMINALSMVKAKDKNRV
jgi:hypothetical protein